MFELRGIFSDYSIRASPGNDGVWWALIANPQVADTAWPVVIGHRFRFMEDYRGAEQSGEGEGWDT